MKRRNFLQTTAVSAGLVFPRTRLFGNAAMGERWRTYEVSTHVEVLRLSGTTRVWLPSALIRETPFQRTLSNEFRAEGGAARIERGRDDGLGIVVADFPAGVKPVVTLTSRVATRDYEVDLSAPGRGQKVDREELEHFLRGTKFVPTDGIVKAKATEITAGKSTDLEKARAIYEWIVVSTFRDPRTRGCGRGDVRSMLETKDLRGKCADLNGLYVGLARAAGLPARDVYGIRTGKSQLGFASLGTKSDDVTKAQHCRAEVYVRDYGWVPVDPADVRKVVLEEPPGNRPMDDEKVKQARARLFGAWEMNWVAYNFAQDVKLPGSAGAPSQFLDVSASGNC